MSPVSSPLPPWKKILYEKQPYEDNYVDESFLSSLIKHQPPTQLAYFSVLCDSFVVTSQFSFVTMAFLVCYFILIKIISYKSLLLYDFFLFSLMIWLKKDFFKNPSEKLTDSSFRMTLLIGGLYILSPILRTLTQSISSDTLWTSSVVLYFLHLLSNDYTFSHAIANQFNGCVSLMASIFASLLLSSRLNSQEEVFAFILFAIELVVLFPTVIHNMPLFSKMFKNSLLLFIIFLPCLFLVPLGSLYSFFYLMFVICMSLLCTFYYYHLQCRYKHKISGPWDEAKINFSKFEK